MAISRRGFVRSGGLALFRLGPDPLLLPRAAYTSPPPPRPQPSRPKPFWSLQAGAARGPHHIVPPRQRRLERLGPSNPARAHNARGP